MRTSLSIKLFRTLEQGKKQLSSDALARLTAFVVSQRTAEESFVDKSGKPDVYYTMFGWMLCYILGIKIDTRKADRYLKSIDPEALDLVHYAAYTRCGIIRQLFKGGLVKYFLHAIYNKGLRPIETFGSNVPHNDPLSPYSQFIRLSILEDAGHRITKKPERLLALDAYRHNGGGYMNSLGSITATTNATVAALAVKGQLEGYNEQADVRYLRKLQRRDGGFSAAAGSPIPDMLSTATALFMLKCYGVKPQYPARDFIEAHWLDSGGFAATLLEDTSDVEYTFYGLLGLGNSEGSPHTSLLASGSSHTPCPLSSSPLRPLGAPPPCRGGVAAPLIRDLQERLLQKQTAEGGMWTGQLSSSAISTSVSIFALHLADKEQHAGTIQKGADWLLATMQPDGSWGDTVESPSNLTATLLAYASLTAIGAAPQPTKDYLIKKFGGATDNHIIKGVLAYYGSDLTFSAPILVTCALAGVISSWQKIPQLPFEAAVLPQKLFRFLRLPVVSYAIPALIAVGILRFRKGKRGLISPVRELFVEKTLRVLLKLQPSNGGFLEAAPLTAFVAICLCGAGYREHAATQRGVRFLLDTVRQDGAWSIDTNLSSWVTALSVRALGDDLPNKQTLAETIKKNAFVAKHPFTGAREGGWGWTNLPGAAPDADDTAGALVALHTLLDGEYCPQIGKGIEWLLHLQNSDGGMPTFCKGWGKLPFDRSSPDISAHAILAFHLWRDALPAALQKKCNRSIGRMLKWMNNIQAPDGSWTPLWFGDQDAPNEQAPVYATAMTVEYLAGLKEPLARHIARKGLRYILSAQNEDGGWGGAPGVPSKVTLTARALSALASYADADESNNAQPIQHAFNYLYHIYKSGQLFRAEPIGLYFSRLWYSEELYNYTFVLNALKKYHAQPAPPLQGGGVPKGRRGLVERVGV